MIAGFARLPFCALGLLALVPLSACNRGPASPAAPQIITPIVTPVVVTLSSIAVSAATVDGGSAAAGTATLSAAAPSGGTIVTLASNNAAATVPASITIAAGASSGTFGVATVAVTSDTDVTISGAAGGVTRTAALRVAAPGPSTGGPVASFTGAHDDIIGGQNSSATVTLSAPAPAGGVRVSLESDDRDVTVPAMLTFEAGAISASFAINTAPVTVAKDVRLTATFVPATLGSSPTAASSVVFVLHLLPVVAPPPPGPTPTLTGMSLTSAVRGQGVGVTLTGTNFTSGATVQITGPSTSIYFSAVNSTTSISVTFSLDSDAAPGPRTVTVTTPGGTSNGMIFTVIMTGPPPPPGPPIAPTLTGMSVTSAERGQGAGVTLTGTNFTYGATVQITGPSTSVYYSIVNSTTSIGVTFNLDSDAPPGPRTVTVTTPGGTSNGMIFTVLLGGPPPPPGPALAPTLTELSPASGVRGAGHGVRLTGTNFVFGATVAATGDLFVSNVIVESTTSIVVTLSSNADAVPGGRTITVTTPAGTSGGLTFTVNAAPEPSLLLASVLSADRTALRDSRARIRF